MNKLKQLEACGQSPWLGYLKRSLIEKGELLALIEREGCSSRSDVEVRQSTLLPKMDFHYDDWFPKEPNVGQETLIYDVMIGDPTLFTRADMVEPSWRIVQPVLDAWAAKKAEFPDYDSGSDGPKAADELLAHDGGRAWRRVISFTEQKQ